MSVEIRGGTAWSPDGKIIAATMLKHGNEVRSVLDAIRTGDGQIQQLYSGNRGIGRPAWMPDGSALIVPLSLPNEARMQLFVFRYPSLEFVRLTNDLSDYDRQVDLTRNGRMLVTVENRRISHVWELPHSQTARAKQITGGEAPDIAVSPGPKGKLLVRSADGEMQLLNFDGTQRTPFLPEVHNYISLSSCGDSYVLFDDHKSSIQLWRADADGSNPKRLADDVIMSACAPDASWLLYSSGTGIYRMGLNGGATKQIAKALNPGRIAISPTGDKIAYVFEEAHHDELRFGTIPSEGGPLESTFGWPTGAEGLQWSPDGKGLQYLLTRGGATNVWEQPLGGGEPRRITNFDSGRIFDFSWTRDGKTLLLAKGDITRDVVLLSNFR